MLLQKANVIYEVDTEAEAKALEAKGFVRLNPDKKKPAEKNA